MGEGFGQDLVASGTITEEQLKSALDYQRDIGGSLLRILVKLGHAKEEDLLKHVAKREGLQIVEGDDVKVDEEMAAKLPEDVIEKHGVVPLGHDATHVELGVADPLDLDAVEEVRFLTGLEVKIRLVASRDARTVLNAYYNREAGAVGQGRGRPRPRRDVHEAARRAAGMPTKAETARQVAEIDASPAKIVRALVALLVDKGVVSVTELAERVRRLE